MTIQSEAIRTVRKVVVFFDICSSTTLLEDLLATENQQRWRNLLIGLKEFLDRESAASQFEIHKFLGDGWILLFDEGALTGEALIHFLKRLCVEHERLFREGIADVLSSDNYSLGMTFGVDSSSLVKIRMNERDEYIGRSLNVAARLQGAIKQKDSAPAGKMLISKSAYVRMGLSASGKFAGKLVTRSLRNISSGERYQARKIVVHNGRRKAERKGAVRSLKKQSRRFVINSAIYARGDHQVDVTDKLRAMVKKNTIEVTSSNQLGGDPYEGAGKVLTIVYSVDGHRRTRNLAEGDTVKLP